MKILKYILFLLLMAFVGSSLYLATLNGHYEVKRTRIIQVPIEVAFDAVNDYKTWEHWDPWNETDSTIVYTFPEKTIGFGATFTWKADSGNGNMENLASIPNEKIQDITHFEGKGVVNGTWQFKKVAEGVEITWKMNGELPFLARFMAAKMDPEIGQMLERGLELLDEYLQKEMKVFSVESVGLVDYGGGYYLYQTTSCRFDEVENKMNEIFANLDTFMKANHIESAGKPFNINHKWDDVMQTAMFSTCIPIKEKLITTDKTVMVGMMNPQRTFKTILRGNYNNSTEAWETAYKNLAVQGFVTKLTGEPFEVFVTNPKEVPNPAKWIKEIYIPIEE
ncbi:MAG: SRPBCC family protein [Flavobacteriaceae bacterium]|nr:SRPBCC family protein [Flavobacteriaceae bacterium]